MTARYSYLADKNQNKTTVSLYDLTDAVADKMTESLIYLYYRLMIAVDTIFYYINKLAKFIYIGVNIVSLINNIVDTIDKYGENLFLTICICIYHTCSAIYKIYKTLNK